MTVSWTTATLDDVCLRVGDGAHSSPASVDEGMPMASVKDLTRFGIRMEACRHISQEDYSRLARQGCRPQVGDVIISKDGATALDVVCEVKSPLDVVLLSSVAILRPNTAKVTAPFLRYYLDAAPIRAYMKNAFTTGAAIPRVVLKDFKRVAIHYPALPAQRKIAAIPSAYDDLIQNNERRIRILETMAQNLYREWFVKFRFPNHQKVKLVDSSLGKIPQGWEVARLDELYGTSSGGTPSRKHPEYFGGKILWVKTQELTDCHIFDTDEKITEIGLNNSSAKVFPENTVLIAMYGATIGQLGILANPAATNQACCAMLRKNEHFTFAFAYLSIKERRQELIDLRAGAAQQNINQEIIKAFKMLKPSLSVMELFNRTVEPLLKHVSVLQKKNNVLRQTRDLLLPRLISGELDVSELDIKMPEV